MNYWILFITIALASWLVSALMQQRFKKYSKVYIPLTGKQVAEKMLRDNGIYDVQVVSTPGHLTDHYDPRTKTVNCLTRCTTPIRLLLQLLQHTNAVTPCSTRTSMHLCKCVLLLYPLLVLHLNG